MLSSSHNTVMAEQTQWPATLETHQHAIDWLMEGDPAIRWQTMRDLLDAPAKQWQAEQRMTLTEGWGAQLLSHQDSAGTWGGGVYSPKWISTTYTLLMLRDIGIPRDCVPALRGARIAVDGLVGKEDDPQIAKRLANQDRCLIGMALEIAVYFGVHDWRIEAMVDNLLDEVMPDGAWNCRRHKRPFPHHSSFHTTFNVLDGLRDYIELYKGKRRADVLTAEHSALELTLQHHLFRSDKTGEVIDEKWMLMSYPHRWHYDAFRGLSYFARINAPRDARLQDAIDLLLSKRHEDGTWSNENRYSAKEFFRMEGVGRKPSRWNTLRALRILKWWQAGA
jgi:hypothetical protein